MNRRLRLGIIGLGIVLSVGVIAAFALDASDEGIAASIAGSIAIVSFILSGVIVIAGRPEHPVGWLLLVVAIGAFVNGGLDQMVATSEGDAARWLAWLSLVAWLPVVVAGLLLLQLFPTGRLLSPRWRVVPYGLFIGVGLALPDFAFGRGDLDGYPGLTNPVGILPEPIANALGFAAVLLVLPAAIGSVASLVVRLYRATGVERKQLRAVGVAATLFIVQLLTIDVLYSLFAALLGAAIAATVLQYRLYDIDRIVNRTVVYGSVSLVLGLAFTATVLGAQAVFLDTAQADLAINEIARVAIPTIVVAMAFNPLRRRVQSLVDRRFNRTRYDTRQEVARFTGTLREPQDWDELVEDIRGVVGRTLAPDGVALTTPGKPA